MIIDLFAGPGGWSEGLRMLSLEMHALEVGLEWDAAACRTRVAAGHRTIRADIAAYPVEPFVGKVRGLIASPPCQDFSVAGKRAGIDGDRGQLVAEVVRWADALRPEWIACEQVPPVLPIWQDYAATLRSWGYSTWCGILNAADYGVPQTRRRAILLASRVRPALPPEPTHAKEPAPSLFGDALAPWVSMAEALGWGDGKVGFPRLDDLGTSPDGYRERDWRTTDEPAFALTEKARSWVVLNPGRTETQPNRRTYGPDEPAPTVAFGHDAASWCWERPATAVCADPRLSPPGYRGRPEDYADDGTYAGERSMDNAVRLTPSEALVLQSFRADYPVQGTKTKQFEQIGNAVPPLLAAHILAAADGLAFAHLEERAA